MGSPYGEGSVGAFLRDGHSRSGVRRGPGVFRRYAGPFFFVPHDRLLCYPLGGSCSTWGHSWCLLLYSFASSMTDTRIPKLSMITFFVLDDVFSCVGAVSTATALDSACAPSCVARLRPARYRPP